MKKSFCSFIKDKRYMIVTILIAILSFGFVVTHSSVNIDTLSSERYFDQGVLIGQGRVTGAILQSIFNVMQFNPFFVDFIAVVLLMIAGMLFCTLFKIVTKDKINDICYIIFSGIFISYPLINEIFVYTPASLSIGFGFCSVAFALLCGQAVLKKFQFKYYLYMILSLFLVLSLYESFASVYICGFLISIILEALFDEDKKINFKDVVKQILIFIIPLVVSLILFIIIPIFLRDALNIPKNGNAQKQILYFTSGIINTLKQLKRSLLLSYLVNGLFYFPITVLVLSVIIVSILSVIYSIKRKSILIFLLFLGTMISLVILSIIQGTASPYRTCQVFSLFCAFAFMLLGYNILQSNIKKIFKNFLIFLIFLIIFYQAKDLHKWFYLNYLRYENEKNTIVHICNEISENYDISKPVVFVGNYELPKYLKEKTGITLEDKKEFKCKLAVMILKIFDEDYSIFEEGNEYIYKYVETNVNSYINWAIFAFGEINVELFNWIELLGYDFIHGNGELYLEAKKLSETMPSYPTKGYINETEEFIMINF